MKKSNLVLVCLCCAFLCLLSSCGVMDYYPEDGEWYSEELQLQLCFGGKGDCFYVFKDEIIKCACGSDKGSSWLSVGCQEADSQYFSLGEEVFGAEFVNLEQDQLVVYVESEGKEYTFQRIK